MSEYQYPMAHRVIKPIREYVPSWRQDVDHLKSVFRVQKSNRFTSPQIVHVGTVIHGKLVPAYMPKD